MSDADLHKLFDQPLDRSLEGLEPNIWLGVAAREHDRRTSRLAASWQAGVLVVAIAIGGVAGVTAATNVRVSSVQNPFLSGAQHAPSSLLFGSWR